MADINDVFYHGVRESIRMVLTKLGPERMDKGLAAFEEIDSNHNWSNCFFAQAFKGELNLHGHDPEGLICQQIGLLNRNGQPNRVPVRTVWHTFDHMSTVISAEEMKKFISDVRDEQRPDEVMQLLRSVKGLSSDDESIAIQPHTCTV